MYLYCLVKIKQICDDQQICHMNKKTIAYIALGIVCFFWGTTYLALRIGVQGFPPFLFSGIRQITAGVMLFALLYLLKKNQPLTLSDVLKQCIPGILLITLGNGIIGWAELYIPSGLAALIVSIIPIYIFIISLFVTPGQNLSVKTIIGLLLGALGIVLIFKDNLGDLGRAEYLWGVLASFGASLFWAIGSVYMKNNTFKTNAYTNAAIQFTSGGIGLFIASVLFDDYSQLSAITSESLWALLYLTLAGSLLAYLAYLYAIEHLPIVVVATYAYVNPVIAILLGYFILNETVSYFTILALATTLYGVYLINSSHKKTKQETTQAQIGKRENVNR